MVDFEEYKRIGDLINSGSLGNARSAVINLLDSRTKRNLPCNEILNHLIREVGLYPYMSPETSDWKDVFAANMFRADVGDEEDSTLHLEQAHILRRLLQGESLAVSAPTSFGKSYIIDAYIAIRKPNCVVIIVPTVALANETRRRLAQKFSGRYAIITTTDETPTDKDIFVFPQERAFAYMDVIQSIDIFIVDEFYKASLKDDRADRLLSVMIEFGKKAKQKYFLGPNIDGIESNPITDRMSFVKESGFKTVVTKVKPSYKKFSDKPITDEIKAKELLSILSEAQSKALIYVSSHPQVAKVQSYLLPNITPVENGLCRSFSEWLRNNYGNSCPILPLIERGIGIHNGNLHRSLAQLQIKLFEEPNGLNTILTTSSIIEGVNTQAEKVILWNNKISNKKLDYFTYRNIIGRAGRMFKYFVGYVYLLEKAPEQERNQIELPLSDEVVCGLDQNEPGVPLNKAQKERLMAYNTELESVLGTEVYNRIKSDASIKGASPKLVLKLAKKIKHNPYWPDNYDALTRTSTRDWNKPIRQIFNVSHNDFIANRITIGLSAFSRNWDYSFERIQEYIQRCKVKANETFKLERDINYLIPSVLHIVHTIKFALYPWTPDIRSFIGRASNAFLPKNVYELEEYGLPRMISKKICQKHLIDLEDETIPITQIINSFKQLGCDNLIERLMPVLSDFDIYIIRYFYDGI